MHVDKQHLEFDVEFTPTGDQYILTKPCVHICLGDDNCDTKAPGSEPGTDNAHQVFSFNSYPQNNQVYHGTGEINPYTSYNNYSIEILPDKITWYILNFRQACVTNDGTIS